MQRLAIVGAGLVGGSLALAARAAGVAEVRLTDADPDVRARARALGLGQVTDTLPDAVHDAELVVAAVPNGAVAPVLLDAAAHAPRTAILTDAASLKQDLTLDIESRLSDSGRDPSRFVAGHPMAGSERSGPDAADGTLFQGATWVLTPTRATGDAALARLAAFLQELGARVLALPPARHDELVAVVSHLPQVVASTLADVAADVAQESGEAVLAVAGGGFRDTTRIAASEPELWVGILEGNRPAVLDALDAYLARLHTVRDALAADDRDELRTWLTRASTARRRLVPKDAAVERSDVVVALDDRPGQLALATTALGQAGINVEDLAMRHAVDGVRGALLVRVARPDVAAATEVLRSAGLHVHVDTDHLDDPVAPGDDTA